MFSTAKEAVAAAPLPELSNGISPEEKEEKQRAQARYFRIFMESRRIIKQHVPADA